MKYTKVTLPDRTKEGRQKPFVHILVRPVMWTLVIHFSIAAMLAALAVVNGVCCNDDASFAVVSRSVAEGRGYATTLNYIGSDFSPQAFHPALGTGPVSILPVALAIYLFGAHTWVPGLTHVLMTIALIVGYVAMAARSSPPSRMPLLLLVFWVLILSVSSRHFGYWYVQIGEPIAALLVLCGYVAWTTISRREMAAAMTGLFLGLAVLTKEMAGLYVLAFVSAASIERALKLRLRPLERGDTRAAVALLIFGSLPFLLFELWRMSALGLWGWLQNWEAHIAFIRQQSDGVHELADMGRLLAERADRIKEHFFPSALFMAGLAGTSVALAKMYGSKEVKRLARFLGLGIAVHVAYWMIFSNGWPRYLYIAVVLWCALIALPILIHPLRRVVLIYLATLAMVPIAGLPDLPAYRDILSLATGRAPLADVHEQKVLAYLDRVAPGEVVYTSWWAHVASLEYLSRRPGRFEGGANKVLAGKNYGVVHVIVDQNLWKGHRTEDDVALLDRLSWCGAPVFTSGPYKVFRCRADAKS